MNIKRMNAMALAIAFLLHCHSPNRQETEAATGQQLADQYCSACHAYGGPGLLPKSIWEKSVLPRMAWRLGIRDSTVNPLENLSWEDQTAVGKAGIYPLKPVIDLEDWHKVRDYILANAPDSLEKSGGGETAPLAGFGFKPVAFQENFPYLTMIRHQPGKKLLFAGNQKGDLLQWTEQAGEAAGQSVGSPPVDISFGGGGFYLTLIGYMHPSEAQRGSVVKGGLDSSFQKQLVGGLSRPVQTAVADLTGNGLDDFIVATFGNQTGYFSWFEQTEDRKFEEHRLLNRPGAIASRVHDFNDDGKPDFMTLMAQGDEEVILFMNEGNGIFKPKSIMRFPAVYGSNDLELGDFNDDGHMDFAYSNGDNGDYSNVPKPYHGIRIFINDGFNAFSESYFYPLYGASGLVADDFDKDGDADIAAIAYFADFSSNPQLFVYLENEGDLTFEARNFRESTESHWLLIEKGDVDQDGDVDILLGANIYNVSPVPEALREVWERKKYAAVILENLKN